MVTSIEFSLVLPSDGKKCKVLQDLVSFLRKHSKDAQLSSKVKSGANLCLTVATATFTNEADVLRFLARTFPDFLLYGSGLVAQTEVSNNISFKVGSSLFYLVLLLFQLLNGRMKNGYTGCISLI